MEDDPETNPSSVKVELLKEGASKARRDTRRQDLDNQLRVAEVLSSRLENAKAFLSPEQYELLAKATSQLIEEYVRGAHHIATQAYRRIANAEQITMPKKEEEPQHEIERRAQPEPPPATGSVGGGAATEREAELERELKKARAELKQHKKVQQRQRELHNLSQKNWRERNLDDVRARDAEYRRRKRARDRGQGTSS